MVLKHSHTYNRTRTRTHKSLHTYVTHICEYIIYSYETIAIINIC